MTLESWKFGDPEMVAIRNQEEMLRKERACGECIHRRIYEQENDDPIRKCVFLKRHYGTRCELFKRNFHPIKFKEIA